MRDFWKLKVDDAGRKLLVSWLLFSVWVYVLGLCLDWEYCGWVLFCWLGSGWGGWILVFLKDGGGSLIVYLECGCFS